jgi:hypothetical protein
MALLYGTTRLAGGIRLLDEYTYSGEPHLHNYLPHTRIRWKTKPYYLNFFFLLRGSMLWKLTSLNMRF